MAPKSLGVISLFFELDRTNPARYWTASFLTVVHGSLRVLSIMQDHILCASCFPQFWLNVYCIIDVRDGGEGPIRSSSPSPWDQHRIVPYFLAFFSNTVPQQDTHTVEQLPLSDASHQ